MSRELKEAIKIALTPPPPKNKESFIREHSYPKTTLYQCLRNQLPYLGKSIWFYSALILFCITLLLQHGPETQRSFPALLALLPFLSLVTIRELRINQYFGMEELEMVCRHSTEKIFLVKLCLIGSFNFVILGTLFYLNLGDLHQSTIQLSLTILSPFLFSTYGSLLIVNRLHTKESHYICYGFCGVTSVCYYALFHYIMDIQTVAFLTWWCLLMCLLLIGLIKEIHIITSKRKDLLWNLS